MTFRNVLCHLVGGNTNTAGRERRRAGALEPSGTAHPDPWLPRPALRPLGRELQLQLSVCNAETITAPPAEAVVHVRWVDLCEALERCPGLTNSSYHCPIV